MVRMGCGQSRQAGVLSLLLWGLSCSCLVAELLTCPDCTNGVSPRAVFCPKCGCPAEFVKEANTEEEQSVDTRTCMVRVKTDQSKGYGVGVVFGEKRYLVVPRHLLDGCHSLNLTLIDTNAPVHYSSLEIAQDYPLARLATTSTNLLYLHARRNTRRDEVEVPLDVRLLTLSNRFASQPDTNIVTKATIKPTREIAVALGDVTMPFEFSVLSSPATNTIFGIQGHVGWSQASNAIPIVADEKWKQVKPSVFREQSALLWKTRQIIQSRKEPSRKEALGMQHRLGETKWLTDSMFSEAMELAQVLRKWGNPK